ncbi:GNAT family N-acetyltransferase [Methylocystis sp. MJC1]|jgi:ribosomal-protein-alanine N-acetyltransferase|uniref:GNAT family N-acetyltransferase n=1 Tax=Methylocystis sp. MJC1 TaxID=2654282 RepID=UPI0013ED64EE|nr:GNAT family N-acetyltransferase [Methylocystis sp. MJC1]KAF2992778.1 Mycothiol acetyltransferase [Methylocystis sp. MJC1]MBU6526740.1 GNAT family N-acetyltransferase [Methylocystis sp. MJC1]UZX13174.1 GNAT family N-acetyltransferase [Methylocystis sp. MJC1]
MSLIASFFAKPTFVVQPIGAERAEECEALHGASFAFGWSKIDFESYLTDPNVIADGAVTEGLRSRLGGFILSRLLPPDSEVLTFAVDPARRSVGLGRRILDKHLENLERGGARLVFLEVADDNEAALKLYYRFGFKEIGRRQNYYLRADGTKRAAVNLRLEM